MVYHVHNHNHVNFPSKNFINGYLIRNDVVVINFMSLDDDKYINHWVRNFVTFFGEVYNQLLKKLFRLGI
jgi:hypothetical protein